MSFYFQGPYHNPWYNPDSAEAKAIPHNGQHGALVARHAAVLQAAIGSASNMAMLHPEFALKGDALRLQIDIPLKPTLQPSHPDYQAQVAALELLAKDLKKDKIDISQPLATAKKEALQQLRAALKLLEGESTVDISQLKTQPRRDKSAGNQRGRQQEKKPKPTKQAQPDQKKEAAAPKFTPTKDHANFKAADGTFVEYPTLKNDAEPQKFPKAIPHSITEELKPTFGKLTNMYNKFHPGYINKYFSKKIVAHPQEEGMVLHAREFKNADLSDEAVKALQDFYDEAVVLNQTLQNAGANETWSFIKHQLIKMNYHLQLATGKRAVLKTPAARSKSRDRSALRQQKKDATSQSTADVTVEQQEQCLEGAACANSDNNQNPPTVCKVCERPTGECACDNHTAAPNPTQS